VAQLDFAERQLTLKLVYFGPPLSGKTSNLRALHQRVDHLNRGRLMTLDTRDDRTLFFDLLPIFFRTTSFSFRIKVYTVPGQPVHEATRKVVLAGADGVVFVADSGPDKAGANREAWQNLVASLHAHSLDRVPIVVQYNKRDVAACPIDDVDHFDDPSRKLFPAEAKAGKGVVPTFFALVTDAWNYLDKDLALAAKLGLDSQTFRATLAEHVVAGDAVD
jgi:mutual gliding-motility protein MglA